MGDWCFRCQARGAAVDDRPIWERYPYNKPQHRDNGLPMSLLVAALVLAGIVLLVGNIG
jgi:hypothetical protein